MAAKLKYERTLMTTMRAQYQAFATIHAPLPLFLILKALTDHSIYTGKLEARILFYLILKGLHHKISKKP